MSRRRLSFPSLLPIISLAIILSLVSFLSWFLLNSRPVNSKNPTRINITIGNGQSVSSIGRLLQDKGLIRSLVVFRLEVAKTGLSSQLQAGDFTFQPSQNLNQIVTGLTHGTTDRWVTILEGWRREEVAQALTDALAPNNPDYVFSADQFVLLTANLEGKLFPDTYSFPRHTTAQMALDQISQNFTSKTQGLTNSSTLTDYQALILASLIEREANHDSQRPIIAGILLKRFQNDWPLQVDATVQYVKASRNCSILTCDWWPQDITKQDLDLASNYNTYAQTGLPPTPVASPGLSSIKAAYNPQSSQYWFYLHDAQGQIHYGKTIEEHNSNISKYLGK